jgi:hypothetical protein
LTDITQEQAGRQEFDRMAEEEMNPGKATALDAPTDPPAGFAIQTTNAVSIPAVNEVDVTNENDVTPDGGSRCGKHF